MDEEEIYEVEATVWIKVYALDCEEAKEEAKIRSNWIDWDLMDILNVELTKAVERG